MPKNEWLRINVRSRSYHTFMTPQETHQLFMQGLKFMRSQTPSGDIHFSMPFAQETDETSSLHHAIWQETAAARRTCPPPSLKWPMNMSLPSCPSPSLARSRECQHSRDRRAYLNAALIEPRWALLPQHLDQYPKEKYQEKKQTSKPTRGSNRSAQPQPLDCGANAEG